MRKAITLLLVLIAMGLSFAGVAFAQEEPTVNVTVNDTSGNPVVIANPGQEVNADVLVNANDEGLFDSFVQVIVDPDTGLQFDPDDAMMTTTDLGVWISNDDPILGGFFFFNSATQMWIWDIGSVDQFIDPGDSAELVAPAVVSDTGDITVITNLFNDEGIVAPDIELESTDSFTFLSVEPTPTPVTNAATVPMQATGLPIALAVLAFLAILGGSAYGKLR